MAGLSKIPAIIRDFSDEQMMEIALLENLQRENLNAIEEAHAYKTMLEKLNITQDQLAIKVGKSRSYVTNMLGILRLPKDVQRLVVQDKLSMGHARMLSKLEDENKIIELANRVVNEGLTVRDIEKITSSEEVAKKNKIVRKEEKSNEFKYIEELLRDKLDTKIKIKDNKVEISFTSVADLNRILEVLNIKE